jgi:hypothetical protein
MVNFEMDAVAITADLARSPQLPSSSSGLIPTSTPETIYIAVGVTLLAIFLVIMFTARVITWSARKSRNLK